MTSRPKRGLTTAAVIALAAGALALVGIWRSSASRGTPGAQASAEAPSRKLVGPIDDHGREAADKQRASFAEEAKGVRRSLAVVTAAVDNAKRDTGANPEYVASLRQLQSQYEARLRTTAAQQASLATGL